MQRFAGEVAAELVPVLQAEGKGRLVGGWQQGIERLCTQYSSHLFPWITIVSGQTPQKFQCGVAWKKLSHIMSVCIWILNGPTNQKWKFLTENSYIFWFLVVLWPGWNHYGKAWRSICRKNDIKEKWLASEHVINRLIDMITSGESDPLSGKGRGKQGQGLGGWWVCFQLWMLQQH